MDRSGVTDALVKQLESRMRELEASTNFRIIMARNHVVAKTKAEARRQHAQEDLRQRRTVSEHSR